MATYQTEAEFYQGIDQNIAAFPYFKKTRHNTAKPPGDPTWSQQMGVLFANFGDVCRSNLWKVKEYQDETCRLPAEADMWNKNRFIEYLTSSGSHIIGILEADSIGNSEPLRKVLSDQGFKLSFTQDRCMMMAARGAIRHDDSSVPVQLLVNSSRNCDRESLPEKFRAPRDIAYAI